MREVRLEGGRDYGEQGEEVGSGNHHVGVGTVGGRGNRVCMSFLSLS